MTAFATSGTRRRPHGWRSLNNTLDRHIDLSSLAPEPYHRGCREVCHPHLSGLVSRSGGRTTVFQKLARPWLVLTILSRPEGGGGDIGAPRCLSVIVVDSFHEPHWKDFEKLSPAPGGVPQNSEPWFPVHRPNRFSASRATVRQPAFQNHPWFKAGCRTGSCKVEGRTQPLFDPVVSHHP